MVQFRFKAMVGGKPQYDPNPCGRGSPEEGARTSQPVSSFATKIWRIGNEVAVVPNAAMASSPAGAQGITTNDPTDANLS